MSADLATRSDEAEVLRMHQDFVTANRTGDTAWCRANMAPGEMGITLFNTNGSTYQGVEHWCELWDYYRHHIKGDRVKKEPPLFESVDPVVTVNGDAAWVIYRLRMAGTLDEEMLPPMARGTEIWRREGDRWVLVHGHWSVGGPGGPAGGL
jgi:ketosteroid isomerase-like protein